MKQFASANKIYKIIVVESESEFFERLVPLMQEIEFRGGKCEFVKSCDMKNAEILVKEHTDIALIFLHATKEKGSYSPFIDFLRNTMRNKSARIILYSEQLESLPLKTVLSENDIHDFINTQNITDQKIVISILSALHCYCIISTMENRIEQLEKENRFLSEELMRKNALLGELPSEVDGRQIESNMNQLLGRNNLLELLDEELERLATHDAVTDVLNRKKFENMLDIAVSHCNRYKTSLSLILLAVNNYMNIVELYGDHTSEDLLKKIVNVIKIKTRKSDVIARWDKDKFIIMFPEAKKQETLLYIGNLRKTLDASVTLEGKRLNYSFGIACFEQEDSLKSLTKRAEDTLHAERNACKNYR